MVRGNLLEATVSTLHNNLDSLLDAIVKMCSRLIEVSPEGGMIAQPASSCPIVDESAENDAMCAVKIKQRLMQLH